MIYFDHTVVLISVLSRTFSLFLIMTILLTFSLFCTYSPCNGSEILSHCYFYFYFSDNPLNLFSNNLSNISIYIRIFFSNNFSILKVDFYFLFMLSYLRLLVLWIATPIKGNIWNMFSSIV